jgi:hypothetical protein
LGGEKKLAVPLAVQQCIHWENIAGRLIRSFRPEKANKKVTDFCILAEGQTVEGSAGRVGISKCGKKSPVPEQKSRENKKRGKAAWSERLI